MNTDLIKIRLKKLVIAFMHPSCWRALAIGVAPSIEHLEVLKRIDIDAIVDVGANRGQFSLACRMAKRGLSILAFEPIPQEAAIFRKVHGRSSNVNLIEAALGETNGTAILHLSKSADSSSLLPIGKRQAELFNDTEEVGTLEVQVQRLDDLSVDYWRGHSRQLLKLDVQGFELNVLRGAVETLRTCAYVYVECSEVLLYSGQALRDEVEGFLKEQGFVVYGRFNSSYSNGELIQADYLFVRG